MAAGGDDRYVGISHGMDESMFAIDATGPESGEFTAERLGFADADERIARDLDNQSVGTLEHLPIDIEP